MSAAATRTSRPRVDPAAFPSMGPGQLRPGRDGDAIDDVLPQAVITARETAHVVATIEEARAKRLGVVTSGGGTLLHVGAVPRAYDIKLSMTAIGNILEQNPEDMTVTCEAGVSMSRLQRALARSGQRLAIDAAAEDRASIGGIVSSNTTGGLRHGFGLPRDLVLGLTAIDGCARTIVAGGRVVKNVAGYDLVRLLTGSWGQLGVITQLTLRTHPLPQAGATLVFEFLAAAELDAARARLMAEPLPLAAVDFAVDAGGVTTVWMLVVRVEGTDEEVAFQGDRVCTLAGRDPSDALEDWASPAWIDDGTGATVKISAAPSSIVAAAHGVLEKLKASSSRLGRGRLAIAGHLGAGLARVHVGVERMADGNTAPFDANAMAALWSATESDGAIRHRVLERGPAAFKHSVEVWGPAPASLPLMRAVKRRLDPDDVLAPGRLAGGL